MRILQVAASIAPKDGGPTTGILGLNRALNALGADAYILATDADGPVGRVDTKALAQLCSPHTHGAVYRRSRPMRFKNSWSQARATFRQAKDADGIHVHGVYLAHSVWAYVAARWHGVPYTCQPHGSLEPYQRQFGRIHKAVWDRVIGHRILAGAAALVAASRSEEKNLRDLIPGAVTVVMPLGVTEAEPKIDSAQEARFATWLSVPREQRILYLGRLAKKKRPDLLIEAWSATTAPSRLAIVGPAETWTHAQLIELCDESVRPRLSVSDALTPPGVAWMMKNAGIFVLPSENENFGIAIAEAMFYGCTIITTEQVAASEHVLTADAGIVLGDADVALLAKALDCKLGDPAESIRSGLRGAHYAAENLTWRAAASILDAQYKKILAVQQK